MENFMEQEVMINAKTDELDTTVVSVNDSQNDFSVCHYLTESVKRDAMQTLFETYI